MSQQQDSIATWVWITTPLVFFAFVGFIYYLSTQPTEEAFPIIQQQAKEALKTLDSKSKIANQQIKDKAKRYDFYKLLEKKSVDVKNNKHYKSTPKSSKLTYQYQLQVASFRSQVDADKLRAELLLEGMHAYASVKDVKGNKWYRVMVGPFSNRSKLNQAQDKLAAKNISALVLKEDLQN